MSNRSHRHRLCELVAECIFLYQVYCMYQMRCSSFISIIVLTKYVLCECECVDPYLFLHIAEM